VIPALAGSHTDLKNGKMDLRLRGNDGQTGCFNN
jgi:hypothetical protein